jgi:hypothetical protein
MCHAHVEAILDDAQVTAPTMHDESVALSYQGASRNHPDTFDKSAVPSLDVYREPLNDSD